MAACLPLICMIIISLAACGNTETAVESVAEQTSISETDEISATDTTDESDANQETTDADAIDEEPQEAEQEIETMVLSINEESISVEWEDNESVTALRELVSQNPLKVQMSMYGGFEQVGSIGTSHPRNDIQTTTEAGDIVLYSGNQIVVFYGSNSWAYTRLGHITDKTTDELTEF